MSLELSGSRDLGLPFLLKDCLFEDFTVDVGNADNKDIEHKNVGTFATTSRSLTRRPRSSTALATIASSGFKKHSRPTGIASIASSTT